MYYWQKVACWCWEGGPEVLLLLIANWSRSGEAWHDSKWQVANWNLLINYLFLEALGYTVCLYTIDIPVHHKKKYRINLCLYDTTLLQYFHTKCKFNAVGFYFLETVLTPLVSLSVLLITVQVPPLMNSVTEVQPLLSSSASLWMSSIHSQRVSNWVSHSSN